MTNDINNFIQVVRYKNGKTKIKHDFEKQANIFKWLKECGYRKSKLDNKVIYYLKHDEEVISTSFLEIKAAFLEFLVNANYINLPSDINHHDVLEWYHSKHPLKENKLTKYILGDNLSESEIHSLRLQTNLSYKHRFQIKRIIIELNNWGFKKTTDKISSYSSIKPPLYYKQINNEEYLIFNHWATETKYDDGFDCWIGIYQNEKLIGKKEPLEINTVQLGFDLDRDITLIEEFLN